MKLSSLRPTVAMADLRQVKTHAPETRNSTRLGYNYKWQQARLQHLAKEPVCRECLADGRYNGDDLHVDHKIPHRGDMTLFWDRSNWQTLCATHHGEKTAMEDGGFGNARK